MVSKHSLILWCLCFFTAVNTAFAEDFDTENLAADLATKTREFLAADTAAARAGMSVFSDDELQRITQAFRKAHTPREQRLFWLSEELYRRNAERVAAERIRYLYYAVLAALAIIMIFSILTYARSRRRALPAAAPAIPFREETPAPARRKKSARKRTR